MKRVILIPCILAVALVGFAANIQLSLGLNPKNTLPGLPVSMRLTATNLSESVITLPRHAVLKVIPTGGEPFVATWGQNSSAAWIGEDSLKSSKLLPGKTTEILFPLDVTLASPGWFFDHRLSWPGVYRLQVILPANPNPENEIPETLISNEAILTIEEPHGEDSLVWNRMLELSNAQGWGGQEWSTLGFSLAREISDRHRTSGYFPYVASMVPASTVAERIGIAEHAISVNPSGPMVDLLRMGIANLHISEMRKASKEGNVVLASQEQMRAREAVNAIMKTSINASILEQAKQKLEELSE